MNFSEADIQQITAKGMNPAQALRQLDTFKKGIPFIELVAAARPGNGILQLAAEEEKKYASIYDAAKDSLGILKFVPASGAASRMFKFLFEFLDEFDPGKDGFTAYANRKKAPEIRAFFTGLRQFPFYDAVLESVLQKHSNYNKLPDGRRKYLFVKEMLSPEGFNYGAYPKALLPFRRDASCVVTAFEAHLFEAALYAASNYKARLHFTITAKYMKDFREACNRIREAVQQKTGVNFSIAFSDQKQYTDAIAVYLNNTPVRKNDGGLLFTASGHGALIENLNELDADIVFIKNVDNVAAASYGQEVAFYKKALAGKLLALQEKSFAYAELLDISTPSSAEMAEIQQFLRKKLNVMIPKGLEKHPEKHLIRYLKDRLNRPLRVCGMVKNRGEPGGGPFWVKDNKGNVSLQIVEAAQIYSKDPQQEKILSTVTHFNPVDLVCGVKNYKGEKYNLPDFTDHNQGFITRKSREGQTVKVLERPGLWNGGMAHWNTVFTEVPLFTFNPVKTVNDLVKPGLRER